MHIGIPREIKPLEGRVALNPAACAELCRHQQQVFVERGAGVPSGYPDDLYRQAGVTLCDNAAELYASAELVVKVKEPVDPEIDLLRPDHVLFSYLHLAANAELAARLRGIGLTAIAFETVQAGLHLPLLAPMSEIAGRLAIQVGTHLLHAPQGGAGIMLGGLPATARGEVVVLGAGIAGGAATAAAAALGANVTVFDLNRDKLTAMRQLGANVTALYAFQQELEEALARADLVVGAVLVPGRRAPRLVARTVVATMRPASVLVDISVDQGGCIETTRPMAYSDPVYTDEGVVHFTVTNLPGAVPRTATQALAACLVPYVLRLTAPGWEADADLAAGINVHAGQYIHPAVRAELEPG